MKKIKNILSLCRVLGFLSVCAILFFAMQSQAAQFTLVNGTLGTNSTVTVGGTNYTTGWMTPSSTNNFNLASGIGTQSNTNQWPSAGFTSVGYPGTLYGPFRCASIYVNGSATTGSTAATFYLAVSQDGANWSTNYAAFAWTPGSPLVTNIDLGAAAYCCINQIRNPNAGGLTNLLIEVNGKPGL